MKSTMQTQQSLRDAGRESITGGPASSAIVQAASKPVMKLKVGRRVKVYERVYWIRDPRQAGVTSSASTIIKWFPAIVYKDIQEAIADIQVEGGKMKISVCNLML